MSQLNLQSNDHLHHSKISKEGDEREKLQIINVLYSALADQRRNITVIWREQFILPVEGSSLYETQAPFFHILAKMKKKEEFTAILEQVSVPDYNPVYIDAAGSIFVARASDLIDITSYVKNEPTLVDDLSVIAEGAQLTGDCVCWDNFYFVEQWLKFHGYPLPASIAQTENLIAFLKLQLPPSPPLGNYWTPLMGPSESALRLTTENKHAIAELINELTEGKRSLLEYISFPNISLITREQMKEVAEKILQNILRREPAKALGRKIHERLGWQMITDDEAANDEHLALFVLAALIIDFDPSAGGQRNMIAGYDLYQPSNLGRTAEDVLCDIENHLIDHVGVPPYAAPLAAHVLLAGTAPELLIKNLSSDVLVGSPGWITLCRAVSIVEINEPGASRSMTYSELLEVAAIAPLNQSHALLLDSLAMYPILDWAVMNDFVKYNAQGEYDEDRFKWAISRYNAYAEALTQSIDALASPLPSRRQITLNELHRELPRGDYLEKNTLCMEVDTNALEGTFVDTKDVNYSIVDLHMSGELVTNGKLSLKLKLNGKQPETSRALKYLHNLKPIAPQFEQAFDQYYKHLTTGMATSIKLALTHLPDQDRLFITQGQLKCYTARKSYWKQETLNDRNAIRGRYGVIISSEYKGQIRAYELFTLRGECRYRPDLVSLLTANNLINATPSAASTASHDKVEPMQWPLDIEAYMEGRSARSDQHSWIVVEKLCDVFPDQQYINPIPASRTATFFFPQLDEIADLLLKYNPIATRAELYASAKGVTKIEEDRAQDEALETALIDMIVPFKKCIEDISSGEEQRISDGVSGCILDALSIVGGVIGLSGKITSIAAKSGSLTSKVLGIVKVSSSFAVSMFNPLDGAPSLVHGGARLFKKGVMQLSKHGVNAMDLATYQVRRLTGSAQSYDLIKAANRSDVVPGSWKLIDNGSESISLLAIRRQDSWYALNLATGKPWGKKLSNFLSSDAAHLPLKARLFPTSYVRSVMIDALPGARNKAKNALSMLDNLEEASDVKFITKTFLGTDTAEGLKSYRTALENMSNDLQKISIDNINIKSTLPDDMAMASLSQANYRAWAAAPSNNEKFINMYTSRICGYYKETGFSTSAMSDALLHEISHGKPHTFDYAYAGRQLGNRTKPGDVDVRELMNLSKGRDLVDRSSNLMGAHMGELFKPGVNIRNPAATNADSVMMTTSLLDQLATNKAEFQNNVAKLRQMLSEAGAGPNVQPVLLNVI
jgi:hypothetical protein